MGYFPFFMDLAGKKGLIVGGGAVAARKAEKLLPFGPRLTVAAPELCPALEGLSGVTLLRRPFAPELLEDVFFAIAATNCPEVNCQVAQLCRQKNILVDVADDPDQGTFLFPALVQRGTLTAGISTGGASPAAAAYLRKQLERTLPEQFDQILDYLQRVRPAVQRTVPQEHHSAALSGLFAACMQAGRPLNQEEAGRVLAQYLEDGEKSK
jgi:siroheme synthase-like protein